MEMTFFFAQDDSSHWYMIPTGRRARWRQLTTKSPVIEGWYEYDYDNAIDHEFGGFRTDGGIGHIEFIPTNAVNK